MRAGSGSTLSGTSSALAAPTSGEVNTAAGYVMTMSLPIFLPPTTG
jgi:hypothetical protein